MVDFNTGFMTPELEVWQVITYTHLKTTIYDEICDSVSITVFYLP